MKQIIETLGKTNRKTLRDAFNFKSISQAKKAFGVKDDIEAYELMKIEYNEVISDENRKIKEIKKQSKKELLKFKNIIINEPTKKSRNDRLNALISNKEYKVETNEREKNYFDRKAFNGMFEENIYNQIDLSDLFNVIFDSAIRKFKKSDGKKYLNASVNIKYLMHSKKSDEDVHLYYTSNFAEKLISPNQIKQWANNEVLYFDKNLEEKVMKSDLVFVEILQVVTQYAFQNKTRGGTFIELPEWIKNKKACVNIKNNDDKCILYCLCAYFHYEEIISNHKSDAYTYKKYLESMTYPKVDFPIDVLKDIPKFEKHFQLKINVFHLVKNELTILYNSRERNDKVINLLLLEDGNKNHFVLIRNLDGLLRTNSHKCWTCDMCLCHNFKSKIDLESHQVICMKHEAVKVVLPEENSKVQFKNFGNKFPHPFSVFLDFESTLQEINDNGKYQKHIANSVGIKYNCIHQEYNEKIEIIQSPNPEYVIENLILKLEKIAKKSYDLTKQNKYHNLTKDEKSIHFRINTCKDCDCEFTDKNKKVVHHNHITGKYISSICNECNLKYQNKKFLPVYVHNLKGYDSHFIVPYLQKYGYQNAYVSCIPNNEEKYISFSKKISVDEYQTKDGKTHYVNFEIRFLDTFSFMATSLEKLAENLKKGCKNIVEYRNTFKNISDEFQDDNQFMMMIQKGVYPYDYITDYSVLSENKLPDIDKFHSKLYNQNCTINDYEKALKVWNLFNCNTLLDYHNIYLKSDVLLLADIWENFKSVCSKIYELDVSYYYTAPGLSWDAFLKHSHYEYKKRNEDFYIELINDIDIYLFVEDNIRGGLSQISKRYAKANHPAMKEYNKNKLHEYILYLDANNLYGYAMCQYLPMKNFQWNNEEWNNDKILQLDDKGKIGYLFDVDIIYPKELHYLHNGYALAPENMEIKNEMLSSEQQEKRQDSKIKKLVTSFYEKKNYGVNYRLLKLYIQLGLKIKVNRVLQYEQSNYMESYIMKNTNERTKAKNDFEKDFYKLMNNSVYGKTMENVRNRINFKLVNDETIASNYKNTLKRFTIFNDDCVGLHLLPKQVELCKPIFIGQNVLDQAKYLMYDFHYNFMLKKFNRENIDLLFTDTDSLCYHIKKQNPYSIIHENKNLFDLSAYPKNHYIYDDSNKKVIGKFKDEAIDGTVSYITEFIGLRSKCYSYITDEVDEHQRCKGVKKSSTPNHQDYKICLFNKQEKKIKQNVIRSYEHQLYTEEVEKTAISHNDDKSYILKNQVETLTLGHYKINSQ